MKRSLLTRDAILITAVTILAGGAFAFDPQPDPPLTAAKFKALPDDALIGALTKRQVVQQLEKLKSEALTKLRTDGALSMPAADGNADHARAMQTQLDEGNRALRSLVWSTAPAPKPVKDQIALKEKPSPGIPLLSALPSISEVIPASGVGGRAARPGGWIAIKGSNLEEFCAGKKGKVLLKGNFPGGGIVALPPVNEPTCSGHAIMTAVPADVSGVVDHQVRLVLQTSDNHLVEAGGPLNFMAARERRRIADHVAAVVTCSGNATFDNVCSSANGMVSAIHIDLPGSPSKSSGSDRFQYDFANGWKLYSVGSTIWGRNCWKSGDRASNHPWTAEASQTLGGAQSYYAKFFCDVWAEGPRGVPMAK